MLTVADLASGWGAAPELDGDGTVSGALHLLDLDHGDGDGDDLEAAITALVSRTALVVGVARRPVPERLVRLAAATDLVLAQDLGRGPARRWAVPVEDVDTAGALLVAQVASAPRAALVLGSLLRQTELLPVPLAVAAEASAYSTLLAGPEHADWLRRRGAPRPALSEDEPVRLQREDDVLRVVIDRPRRAGAFDARVRDALVDAFRWALADPSLLVELSGLGASFSSGGDLDEFGSTPDPATAWVVRTVQHPGALLHRLGPRASARVHGPCVGAGVELPAFAQRLTAAPGTTFRLPEMSMGLLPGAGGTVSVPRRIGRWRAAWLALGGQPLDLTLALDWGLVDGVSPS